jgi:hypothetical protein
MSFHNHRVQHSDSLSSGSFSSEDGPPLLAHERMGAPLPPRPISAHSSEDSNAETPLVRVERLIRLVQESPIPFHPSVYWGELEPKLREAHRLAQELEEAEERVTVAKAQDRRREERELSALQVRNHREVLALRQELDSVTEALSERLVGARR